MDTPVETSQGSPPPPPADPMVGRLLDGRYRLDALIAHGGMGSVYRGTDERLDRTIAVKVVQRGLGDDPEFAERFAREARAAAKLSAPEVVAVHDQGHDAGAHASYLVMEHVPGGTLRTLLKAQGAQAPERALRLVEPVVTALAAAHAAGLVHRDVKPENVLLGADGRIKVADFGLARAVEASTMTVVGGGVMGTPAYLAPEQIREGRFDVRSDVYAAGIVLFELLTGTPPFPPSGGGHHTSYRHVTEDVPAPSTVVEGIPPAVDELVLHATRRDPSQRPVDAGALLAELRDVRSRLPLDAPTTVVRRDVSATQVVPLVAAGDPVPGPPAPPRRRRRGRIAAAVVVVLALLAGAAGWYLGSGRFTDAPAVLGLTLEAATTELQDAGLKVRRGTDVFSETVRPGQVVDQDPDPGARVRKSGTVSVVLSKGPDRRAVPALVGRTEAAAATELTRVGLQKGATTQEFSDDVDKGLVLRTDPVGGTKLRPGQSVRLVVSKGPDLVAVPSVVGRTQAEAGQAVQAAGLRSDVIQVFSDTVPVGRVVAQDPAGGRARRGSTVELEVSKGPEMVLVPNLGGKTRQEAQAALTAVGLRGNPIDVPDGRGVVITQTPRPGTKVKPGTTVTYYVF